jgi:hypothetical protein
MLCKQQFHSLFQTSQSVHIGIYLQLLLVWVPHGSFETVEWYTTAQFKDVFMQIQHLQRTKSEIKWTVIKWICRHEASNLRMLSLRERCCPALSTVRGYRYQYIALPWDVVPRLGSAISKNSCFSSNEAHTLMYLPEIWLAKLIVVNGRQIKSTYREGQGFYEWMELWRQV